MKLDIYNKTGKKSTKKLTLSDAVFAVEPNDHCVYLAVNSELAALRQVRILQKQGLKLVVGAQSHTSRKVQVGLESVQLGTRHGFMVGQR